MTDPNDVTSLTSAEWRRILDRQERDLQFQLDWIRAIDGKVAVVVALAMAMLTVIGAIAPPVAQLSIEAWILMGVGTLPLMGALCCCALAMFPQTEGPMGSLVYFGGICDLSSSGYCAAVLRQSDFDHFNDLNAQCYRNAHIAEVKYTLVRRSMLWLLGATPGWLVTAYLLHGGR